MVLPGVLPREQEADGKQPGLVNDQKLHCQLCSHTGKESWQPGGRQLPLPA